jgi:hypothetical protein
MTNLAKNAKKQLIDLGVTLTYNADLKEYRVNLKGAPEACAYYTDDLEDAIGTGEMMHAYELEHKRFRPETL